MTVRRALTSVNGLLAELPTGDSLPRPVLDKGTITVASTITFTASQATSQRLQVGVALTIATTGWEAANFSELVIQLVNGAAFAVTWPTVNWVKSDGTVTTSFASNGITLQTTGTDWIYLWTVDGGSVVYGRVIR